jgi:lipopolysaccharide/colanic/teichoic acid biosynthesis glycosyltransferase
MASVALASKRLFDLVVASMVLICLSPVIGLIALAIKLDDNGPVLFIQDRVGRHRRKFRCYKFRTMILGAENIGHGLTVVENDSRVTRVGRLLRLWTLDEIPQLFNILKGDMSVVGPRPWVPAQAAYCPLENARRFNFKPGMAGWAWIHGRNSVPWEERVRLDLWYVDNWTLSLDLSILVKALLLLIRRQGVYGAEGESRAHDAQQDQFIVHQWQLPADSSFMVRQAQTVVTKEHALQAVQED